MAVVKVIEVLAQSDKSWEDAVQVGVKEIAKTVRAIKSVYVKDLQAVVEGDVIVAYRANMKVSFVVER